MKHKYGNFTETQMVSTKKSIRKQIFFLLLCADPETKDNYAHVDVDEAFKGLLYRLDGLNSVLGEPQELVDTISLLEEALIKYNEPEFNFRLYRRLILNAGSIIDTIREVD